MLFSLDELYVSFSKRKVYPDGNFHCHCSKVYITNTYMHDLFSFNNSRGNHFRVSMAMILENIEDADSTLLNSRGIRKSIVHFLYF